MPHTDKSHFASAIIMREGKILIAKRAETKKSFPGKWEIPGGKIEAGETPEQALERELREELGVSITVGEPVMTFKWTLPDGTPVVETDYFATLTPDNQAISIQPHDHSDYTWIEAAEVSEYFDADDQNGAAVIRAFFLATPTA